MKFFKNVPENVKKTAFSVASTTFATFSAYASAHAQKGVNHTNGRLVYNPAGCWQYLPENETKSDVSCKR